MHADPVFMAALVESSGIHRDTALQQVHQGKAVVPCHVLTPHGCSCGRANCATPGAHALVAVERASSNEEQVRSWWMTWGGAAVGIVEDGRLRRVLADPATAYQAAPPLPNRDAALVEHVVAEQERLGPVGARSFSDWVGAA